MADYTMLQLSVTVDNGAPATHLMGSKSGPTVTNRSQRVYDSTAGWCYYTKPVDDAAPSAGETNPNHTGNLSVHQVINQK